VLFIGVLIGVLSTSIIQMNEDLRSIIKLNKSDAFL